MSPYQLRAADDRDRDDLLRIHLAAMSAHLVAALGEWSEDQAREHLDQWLRTGRGQVILVDGVSAGLLDVVWKPDALHVIRIEIDPSLQGRGIGSRLMADLLAEAGRRGVPVRLDVFEANPARRLYERLGFQATGHDGPSVSMEWQPPSTSDWPHVGGPLDPTGGTAVPGGESARGYLLDNARVEAGERFVWLAELFDGVTRGHFDRLGVRAGSRCWEVGAGGRSIPEALAAAVGPTGHVLATDIDLSWLKTGGGYEVRQHDVAADPPPEHGTFDLVHARLVLVHVPDRARALATMVAALRPGGWLLVEDADTALQPLACLDDSGPAQRRANRLRDAVRELLARRGADLRYGRTLPRALREAGLVDVAAVGSFPVGGLACDRLEAATIRHVRGELLAAGLADDAEIDAHLAAIDAGELDLTLAPLISAWGRRPPSPGEVRFQASF